MRGRLARRLPGRPGPIRLGAAGFLPRTAVRRTRTWSNIRYNPAPAAAPSPDAELRPGERYYSVLLEEGGKFIRKDYGAEAWHGRRPAPSASGGAATPPQGSRRQQPIDDEMLMECFRPSGRPDGAERRALPLCRGPAADAAATPPVRANAEEDGQEVLADACREPASDMPWSTAASPMRNWLRCRTRCSRHWVGSSSRASGGVLVEGVHAVQSSPVWVWGRCSCSAARPSRRTAATWPACAGRRPVADGGQAGEVPERQRQRLGTVDALSCTNLAIDCKANGQASAWAVR